jgi:uncharacterized protein (DUF4415 family)
MRKETVTYTDAPPDVEAAMARSVIVADDFLPSPAELAAMSKKEKVTIALDRSTVEFFKSEAKRNGTKYQTMINRLLGSYASTHAAR